MSQSKKLNRKRIFSWKNVLLMGGCFVFSGCQALRVNLPRITPNIPPIGPLPAIQSSVKPLADGEDVFPEIANTIKGAEDFISVVIWAFDEDINFHGTIGQNATAPFDIRCSNPVNPHMAKVLLRCQAAKIANLKRQTASNPLLARANMKVIVYHMFFDGNHYAPPYNDVGDLGVIEASLQDALRWTDTQLHDELRERGSGESEAVMRDIRDFYRRLQNYSYPVYFPTGIYVVTQPNRGGLTGSHHQKALISEKQGYVGGINFLKEFWDLHSHLFQVGGYRASSSMGGRVGYNPAAPDFFNGPLHDTGAILRGGVLHRVNHIIEQRWVDVLRETGNRIGRHPYGPMIYHLEQVIIRLRQSGGIPGARHNIQVLRNLITYLETLERGLLAQWQLPRVVSAADPAHIADNAAIRVSIPAGSMSNSLGGVAGAMEIRGEYVNTINRLTRGASFFYFENQYFTDVRITKTLGGVANSLGNYWNHDPFGVIVIPYIPEAIGIQVADIISREVPKTVKAEMRNLKWLEVKTARSIMTQDGYGNWVVQGTMVSQIDPVCPYPLTGTYVKFIPEWFGLKDANSDPEDLELDTKLDIVAWLHRQGNPVTIRLPCGPNCWVDCPKIEQLPRFKVREVMTRSTIEAFTLAADDSPRATGNTPEEKYHNFFDRRVGSSPDKGGIYIHSKASIFLNLEGPLRHRATIGSANISPRSMGRGPGGKDTEMNIFWSSDKVMGWWQHLWKEHSNNVLSQYPNPAIWPEKWMDLGWKNYLSLRTGVWPGVGSRVVRLDVVQRCLGLLGRRKCH